MILKISFLRNFLFLVLLVSGFYVAYTLSLQQTYPSAFHSDQISDMPSDVRSREVKSSKDYESFLSQIQRRELFAPVYEEQAGAGSEAANKILSDLKRNLKLVGVIKNTPKKAVIEHIDLHQSFYLSEGESFLEGVVVEEIKDDSVRLRFNGEHIEFYL